MVKVKAPTQAELLARALDAEEGNIAAHRDYLALEEEKRRKERIMQERALKPQVKVRASTPTSIYLLNFAFDRSCARLRLLPVRAIFGIASIASSLSHIYPHQMVLVPF